MKRLIIFLLLFAAIKVAGQTTGYLRFDTVMIMKSGGSAELVLLNKSKDTVGILANPDGNGRTRFMRSRAINDSTIIVGPDTLIIPGNSQLFDLTSTRIAYGNNDNQITDNANLTYNASTNRFNTGTGEFADSVVIGTFPREVDLTYNQPLLTYDFSAGGSITNISGNSYIKNQYSSQQFGHAWFDSARLGNLILSRRGGTQPSIFSESSLWYMSRGVHVYSGWDANEYPLIQMTTFNNNQSNRFSGVITGFNFSNSGTTNKPLVIATSGFSNARAGDIILSTGRGLLADTLQDTKTNVNYNIILDPSGSGGEVQMTRVTNFQSGWKASDSVLSSTTVTITTSRAMWIFTGSSTATWTLPAVSGNSDVTFYIKNKGSADIVLTAGTNEIYSSAATTTFNIIPGQGYIVHNDGTNWTIMNN